MIVILRWSIIIFLSIQPIFQFLEFVFFNEGCDTDSICKGFISVLPSLYRIISHINKIIKKQYRFEISLNPVRITGNEIDIRYFLPSIFREILFP